MKSKSITRFLAMLAIVAAGSFTAQAATAAPVFSDLAIGSTGSGQPPLFDASLTDLGNPVDLGGSVYSLAIGLTANGTSSGGPALLADSFALKITAPAGFYISFVDYGETYSYSAAAAAGITMTAVANGQTAAPAYFIAGGGAGNNVDISLVNPFVFTTTDTVMMNVSNTIFAVGDSSMIKDSATLLVGLTPVPLPPALGLLGAALIGLATVSSRRNRNA
ncbi:MAG: hypothetical protein WD928_12015 [Gammaproteobacteria bacterium]